MKKILTTIAILISLSCFGQKQERDTIKCPLVVFDTVNNKSFPMMGYAVRVFNGNQFVEIEYLNNQKQPFLKRYRVWSRK